MNTIPRMVLPTKESKMKLIDSHAHPNNPQFSNPGAALRYAKHVGIEKIVVPVNWRNETEWWDKGLAFVKQYEGFLYPAIGIHPLTTEDLDPLWEQALTKYLVENPQIVAVGEIGLDFSRSHNLDSRYRQKDVFKQATHIAGLFKKPIIVHSRNAANETIECLREYSGRYKGTGVIHSFSGNKEDATRFLTCGFHLSFSGLVCLSRGKHLREVVEMVPLDRMLVETDSPYLSPNPSKYRVNEPALLPRIVKQVAKWKKLDVEEVAEATRQNAIKLFGLE